MPFHPGVIPAGQPRPVMARPLAIPNSPRPQAAAAPARPPAPRPTVRLQSGDDLVPPPAAPRPAPLNMPSPEQLGVNTARPGHESIDWNAAHRRLNQLGATCFRIDKLDDGRWRATCLLPTAQQGKT